MKRRLALAISLLYGGTSQLGRWIGARLGRTASQKTIILTYHSVPANQLAMFESQMRVLRAVATPVFADDEPRRNGRPCVAVTFDDAFQNVFDGALPIMARYGIPATVFVPTGYLGGQPGWAVTPGTTNRPADLVAASHTLAAADRRLIKFGSHTVSHPRLATVSAGQLDEELTMSRQTLERLTGSPVTLLALPYGSFNEGVLNAADSAGYKRVFANVPVRLPVRRGARLVGR